MMRPSEASLPEKQQSSRPLLLSLGKGLSKLEEMTVDFEAKLSMCGEDQVLKLKEVELKGKLEELRQSDIRVKVSVAQVKYYLKIVGQKKEVEPPNI